MNSARSRLDRRDSEVVEYDCLKQAGYRFHAEIEASSVAVGITFKVRAPRSRASLAVRTAAARVGRRGHAAEGLP